MLQVSLYAHFGARATNGQPETNLWLAHAMPPADSFPGSHTATNLGCGLGLRVPSPRSVDIQAILSSGVLESGFRAEEGAVVFAVRFLKSSPFGGV